MSDDRFFGKSDLLLLASVYVCVIIKVIVSVLTKLKLNSHIENRTVYVPAGRG